MCVSGWWLTTGKISWLGGSVGRSLWCPPMSLAWFMVRLWFGQELFFAPCCHSSIPSSLSSSSTLRRWTWGYGTLNVSHLDLSLVLFYISTASVPLQITLFNNCRPALKTFRSTTSTFFFLFVLLVGWGLATVVMVYSLAEWVLVAASCLLTNSQMCFHFSDTEVRFCSAGHKLRYCKRTDLLAML